MLSGARTLASTLLLLIGGPCTLGACVLPQEDRVLNFPPLRNRPPRIMEELNVKPDNRVIEIPVNVDPCPRLEFGFFAEDPDVDDTLNVRWFIDYHVLQNLGVAEQTLSPSGKPVRDDTGSYTVDLAGALTEPEARLQLVGTHVVEAILFDGRLGPQRKPLPRTPAIDGGVENPSYAVSYAWVVQTMRSCPLP